MGESANPVRGRSLAGPASPEFPTDPGWVLVSIADAAVHRLVAVGQLLEGATDMADGDLATQIQRAASQLDGIIRDIRTAAFGLAQPQEASGLDTGWP